ncbi:MAG: hypothetical protein ACUVWN_00235 [bacterium]
MNSINANNTIVSIPDIAKIQNKEHHRGEVQGQQFSLAMQKETLLKETQVQNSNKPESVEIKTKQERKSLYKKKDKKKPKDNSRNIEDDEIYHIDLTI